MASHTESHNDMIATWSYSRLIDFEACPFRAYLKYSERIPSVQHPAAARGTTMHTQAEEYINGTLKELPSELSKFKEEFHELGRLFKLAKISLEGEWGFDKDWLPTNYKGAWLRLKADAVAHLSKQQAIVIDFKSGRKDGNEIKHGEQTQLYAIATFIREPELEEVKTELWYLDKDELTSTTYTRAQALRYVQPFTQRAEKMINAEHFPANPTVHTCKWCDYGPSKGKQCAYGVSEGYSPIKFYRQKYG